MTLPAAFAGIARGFAASLGAPFKSATIANDRPAVLDAGGSIVTPTAPAFRSCLAQVDAATDLMRREDGYQDRDVALILLEAGAVSVGEKVSVDGETYRIESVGSDPAGIGALCRGRPA